MDRYIDGVDPPWTNKINQSMGHFVPRHWERKKDLKVSCNPFSGGVNLKNAILLLD